MNRIRLILIITWLTEIMAAMMWASAVKAQSVPTAVEELPVIKEMPDPLTMNDGTKVTTPDQWKARRLEMMKILEDYEYGHMPPPPGNVKAITVTPLRRVSAETRGNFGRQKSPGPDAAAIPPMQADYRMLHLSFGPDNELGFDLGLFTPVTPIESRNAESAATDQAPAAKRYPVLISPSFSAGEYSLGPASAALSRGYAVATIPYQQLGADAPDYRSTAFFPAYPKL